MGPTRRQSLNFASLVTMCAMNDVLRGQAIPYAIRWPLCALAGAAVIAAVLAWESRARLRTPRSVRAASVFAGGVGAAGVVLWLPLPSAGVVPLLVLSGFALLALFTLARRWRAPG